MNKPSTMPPKVVDDIIEHLAEEVFQKRQAGSSLELPKFVTINGELHNVAEHLGCK